MTDTMNRIMTLPTIALRGASVFPGTVLQFDVERPASVAAVNSSIGTDRMIFLTSQKDAACETPGEEDLYDVGTVCRMGQMLRTPGGSSVRCIVEGLRRAKLLRITSDTPCLWANVRLMSERTIDMNLTENIALLRSCKELFSQYAAVSGTLTPETLLKIQDREDPSFVTDYIAHNIYLSDEDKQSLLQEDDPGLRMGMLVMLIRKECEIIEFQKDLQEVTSERVARSHKEYFLREQMHVIQDELGENQDSDESEDYRARILEAGFEEDTEKKLLKELSRLEKQPFGSAEGAVIRTYLDICLDLPWKERTKDIIDIDRAAKCLDEDHYGLVKVKERILEFLAVRQMSSKIRGGVICLVGPPGVGKTSVALSVARALGRRSARLSLGGVHDEAEIRGHRKTYVGAMPGRIIAGIQQAGTKNPVLVLDEIDKLGSDYRGDPSAALLEALDTEQNSTFRDHFLEIPFDLSEVLFITTANTADTIPRALLDRMEVIYLGSYTDEEKLQIAKRHLVPKQRALHGLNGHQIRLSDDAIREIISLYTKEAGVRNLEREIAALCRKATLEIAAGRRRSLRLSAGELEPWLGPAKVKPESTLGDTMPGLVHGLAWTSAGGEVLNIECLAVPGSGKMELTGNLGDVMKESCRAALSYIRSRTALLNIPADFYQNLDLHIHFPEGAVPKDGPSAGAAVCLCMVSALTGRPVRADIALTGEITLRGRILAIGGVQEKSMGALRAGIREIVIPEQNAADLTEIDPDVRDAIVYHPVDHMDQVLELAFEPQEKTKAEEGELVPPPQADGIAHRTPVRA